MRIKYKGGACQGGLHTNGGRGFLSVRYERRFSTDVRLQLVACSLSAVRNRVASARGRLLIH